MAKNLYPIIGFGIFFILLSAIFFFWQILPDPVANNQLDGIFYFTGILAIFAYRTSYLQKINH